MGPPFQCEWMTGLLGLQISDDIGDILGGEAELFGA
jgi:hypothetical protein